MEIEDKNEKTWKTMENIPEEDIELVNILLKGEESFKIKDYETAYRNYTKYVAISSHFLVENGGFKAGGKTECGISIIGRKNSRCIYELEGLKASRKYLMALYNLYQYPIILGQLAVFLRESGHIKSAEYYEEREKILEGLNGS